MELYKEDSGRRLNNYSEVYQLPADEEEFERLGKDSMVQPTGPLTLHQTDRQHILLEHILGYRYVPGMAEVLTHVPGQRRRSCVDLGCGSGSWYFFSVHKCDTILTHPYRLGSLTWPTTFLAAMLLV